jgi:hypothetical protein
MHIRIAVLYSVRLLLYFVRTASVDSWLLLKLYLSTDMTCLVN